MNDIRKLMEAVERVDEYYDWDDQVSIEEFKGKVFTEISGAQGKEELVFKTSPRTANEPGETFVMVHQQDCCESVWLEEVVGDLDDLIGSEIIEAEEVVSKKENPPDRYKADEEDRDYYGEYMVESHTWTFYKLGTMKGHVTLRWYGTSNGYYSESVQIYKKVENETF